MSSASSTKETKRRFRDFFKLRKLQTTSIRGTDEEQNEANATSRPMQQLSTPNDDSMSTSIGSSNAPTISVDADASSSSIVGASFDEDDLNCSRSSETRLDEGLQSVGSAATRSDIKSGLDIAGRFAQTLLKKLPDCVDSNPVKMALSIVKTVILIKNEIGDNKDALTESLQRTRVLLDDVVDQVESGHPEHIRKEIETYKHKIGEQYTQLSQITKELESRLRHLDYENYKKRIGTICNTIHETTNAFMLRMQLEIVKKADEIKKQTEMMHEQMKEEQKERRMMSLQGLNPSRKADHKTVLEGQSLKRETCAEGTRVEIIEDITIWANDCAEDSPHVFWLTGQAGSGKTTIAYTIAKQFEKAEDQSAVLGSNFLCSRQFEETRSLSRIIPTLAYQLAGKCLSYQAALHDHVEDMAAVTNHDISEQMEKLLVKPWNAAKLSEDSLTYLIVVDALDEINEDGGSKFLAVLLTTIDRHNLHSLKFLVTSRTDPQIVRLCDTFNSKTVCRLQDVPIEQAEADVGRYLHTRLPELVSSPEMAELEKQASGLFIYAATAVRILTTPRSMSHREQLRRLSNLLSKTPSLSTVGKDKSPIDGLYAQILCDAFSEFPDEEDLAPRLHILFTYLCTADRISPSVAAALMDDDEELARLVLDDLHPVLYIQDDRVFWYHASFPDFIMEQKRSNFSLANTQFNFWCNLAVHHSLLASSCFRIMASKTSGLKFNMGGITSSYLLDSECVDELSTNLKKEISPALRYACLYWSHHLSSSSLLNTYVELMGITISEFLQIRVLFWLEAMNLMKVNDQCVPNLHQARRWVLDAKFPADSERKLEKNLMESANFATYFISSPASESTPHLYISSLATWKSESTLTKKWRNQFSSIPHFIYSNATYDVPLLSVDLQSNVRSVAFSNDGTRIVAGSSDKTIQIIDASTGKVLKILTGHTEGVCSVSFSNNDKWIASGSWDKAIRMWDTSTGICLKILEGHTDGVTSVVISTNDMLIGSGSYDRAIHLWDVSTGNILKTLTGHTDRVNTVLFLMDSTRIVSGSDDRSFRIWDVSSGQELIVLEGHAGTVLSVAATLDGSQVVSASGDKSMRVWDAATGVEIAVLEGLQFPITSVVAVSLAFILSGSLDGSVQIWDMTTGDALKVLPGHNRGIDSVGYSSNPTRVVSGLVDGFVQVWNLSDVLAKVDSRENGNRIITSLVTTVGLSGGGMQAIFGAEDGSVRIWDLSTYQELGVFHNSTEITSVAVSKSGSRFGWATSHEVWAWDILTNAKVMVQEFHVNQYIRLVAFSNEENLLVVAPNTYDNGVHLWDESTGECTLVPAAFLGGIPSFRLSQYGQQIVSVFDAPTNDWEASSRKYLRMKDHRVFSLDLAAFSDDASCIISGSEEATMSVLDALAASALNVLGDHMGQAISVAFTNNNSRVVCGSKDSTVRVWDVDTGQELSNLRGRHTMEIESIAVASDARFIISASEDGSVIVWDMEDPPWHLAPTNWILSSPTKSRLMWVPTHSKVLQRPNCRILVGESLYSTFDFEQMMLAIGPTWEKCYTPDTTAAP